MGIRTAATRLIAPVALVALLPIGTARPAERGADIAEPFRDYYSRHQGMRIRGVRRWISSGARS